MNMRMRLFVAATAGVLCFGPLGMVAQATPDVPTGPPEATIDLATAEGVPLVQGTWRYSDVKIIEEVVRLDPAMDAIVGPNPKLFKLTEGFKFTEGPVWVRNGGYLLFSDPNSNVIYKYTKDGQLSVFRQPSGYAGTDIAEYGQPGSNGLTFDAEGRLTINEHGNRRVTRLEQALRLRPWRALGDFASRQASGNHHCPEACA